MTDLIRNLLLLAAAAAAVTLIGSAIAYWTDEERRLRRLLRRALDAPPQMVITARGGGRGAGLNLDSRQVAVLWDGGVRGLVYRLDQLVGAELIIDDRVAARAFRDEPRRALDEVSADARRVLLRLVFDNPRDPDFELALWPHGDPAMIRAGTAVDAIQAARRWVSSVEAILRRAPPRPPPAEVAAARVPQAPPTAPPDPPWTDDTGETDAE